MSVSLSNLPPEIDCISHIISEPLWFVKFRMEPQDPVNPRYISMNHCLHSVAFKEGIPSLFKQSRTMTMTRPPLRQSHALEAKGTGPIDAAYIL
jgi:hypothetical protein